MKHRFFAVPVILAVLGASADAEDSDAAKARALIKEMEDLYRASASRASVTMRVETPNYRRTMTMESISLGTEKSLIRILTPKKDRGIATLKQDQEMWNYFPKINKVIKVPPSMMMGSWMGSDFTNDDIVKETSLVDEYDLSLTETDRHYEVILTPREQTVTVWGKIVYTIDKQLKHPVSQVFYADDGEKVRVLTYSEPRQFRDSTLPSVMEMVPVNKPGQRTVVVYDSLQLNDPDIDETMFSLRQLKKRMR